MKAIIKTPINVEFRKYTLGTTTTVYAVFPWTAGEDKGEAPNDSVAFSSDRRFVEWAEGDRLDSEEATKEEAQEVIAALAEFGFSFVH